MKKLVVLLVTTGILLSGCVTKEEPPVEEEKFARAVQTTAIGTGEISNDFTFSGKVAPSREVAVVPTVPGKVTTFHYDIGDSVAEGAELFTVDSTDLQNNLRSIEANYNATKLQVDNAKSTLESNRILYEEGMLAKADFDKLQLAYDTAEANLVSIQIQKENIEKSIADCAVTAPISGIITQRGVEIGSFASQGGPAYTIMDVSVVKVEVGVSEQMVNQIQVGKKVDVALTAVSPEPLQGIVSSISPTATQAGTYTVKVTLNNNRKLIKVGMLAEVKFVTEMSANTIVLPRDAVLTKEDETYVYIVENNVTKKIPVVTGIESGERIEVKEGLSADMQVVTKGQTYITDGEEVRVSNPQDDVLRVPIAGADIQSKGE